MNKRLLIATIITIFLSIILSFSYCFATDENMSVVDGIRNFVGGAENVIEDAGSGIVNGVKSGINGTENAAKNVGNAMAGTMRTTDDNYTAERTDTTVEATSGDFLGMDSTMWTWIIMALVGIAIVVLVWAYSKENHYNSHNNNDL